MLEPILFGLGGLLFGYIASSSNKRDDSLTAMNTLIEQNKEFVELSSSIEIMNRDINNKTNRAVELDAEIEDKHDTINRLIQRAEYLRNSGELEKLEELSAMHEKLKHIKNNLNSIQKKHEHRFNISVLISLVQDMYQELNDEELDLLAVQQLMEEYSANSGGDSFGGMTNKPEPEPKQKSSFRRNNGLQ